MVLHLSIRYILPFRHLDLPLWFGPFSISHSPPTISPSQREQTCTLTSRTEQSSGKHMKLNAPWPLHRFYKQYFSLRYQSVLTGSVLKKESRTLTNLFTLSWEEKNLKTSAFLSRGLIVNYPGKRKNTQWEDVKTKLKLLILLQTSALLHFSPGKQWFMLQTRGEWCKNVLLKSIRTRAAATQAPHLLP